MTGRQETRTPSRSTKALFRAIALTAMMSFGPAGQSGAQALNGINPSLSSDGEAIIDSNAHPWASIGRVNRAGYRSTSMCTGSLIAPNVVLTAAHCLFDRVSGRAFRPEDVVFLAGVRREEFSAKLSARCFRIDQDYDPVAEPQLQNLYSDVALIILNETADLPIVDQVPFSHSNQLPTNRELISVGYHKDRRFLPTADPSCKAIGAVKGAWVTDCATKQGASGGPVFLRDGNDIKITAIMSAKAGDKASVVVPRNRWQTLIDTAICPADAAKLPERDPLAPQPLSAKEPNTEENSSNLLDDLRPSLD